jgi:hypothetical protein
MRTSSTQRFRSAQKLRQVIDFYAHVEHLDLPAHSKFG